MQLHVKVEQRHIEAGRPSVFCPIDYAVGDLVGGVQRVSTGAENCWLYLDGEWGARIIAPLPEIAREFVRAFDGGDPVHPVEFDLTFA